MKSTTTIASTGEIVVDSVGVEESGKVMKPNVNEQAKSASAMTGIDSSRIRRRPRRSMSRREMMVKMKFVHATVREVRVGEAKPRRENRVAEKYISEFCQLVSTTPTRYWYRACTLW